MKIFLLFLVIGFTSFETKAQSSLPEPDKPLSESETVIPNNSVIPDASVMPVVADSQKEESMDARYDWHDGGGLELQTILQLKNNPLKPAPYQWSASMPWAEILWHQPFLKDNHFKLVLELSYQDQEWDYFLSQWFFEHTFSLGIPIQLQWGYFEIDYRNSNDLLVSKRPLVDQKLFPKGESGLGLALKTKWDSSWSVILALRAREDQKANLDLTKLNQKAIGSAHAIYNKQRQQAFMGWLIEDRVGLGRTNSVGLGSDFNASYRQADLRLKTEAWYIQNQKSKNQVWYVFPYIKLFDRFGLGYFVGSFKQNTDHGLTQQSESVLKADFYLKDSTTISIEHIQEYSSVYSQSSWNLSLKNPTKIPPFTKKMTECKVL